MTANELRQLLAGTGAKVVELRLPSQSVYKHRFKLAEKHDGNREETRCLVERRNVSTNMFPTLESVKKHYAGKRVLVYNCLDKPHSDEQWMWLKNRGGTSSEELVNAMKDDLRCRKSLEKLYFVRSMEFGYLMNNGMYGWGG